MPTAARTQFVILAAPRTGSNLLCTLLNSHTEILCHHELFNPQGIFTARGFRDDAIESTALPQRDRDPVQFLESVLGLHLGHRYIGFKWTRGQNEVVLSHVLQDPDVKKVVLRRRNRLKTYVSERIAQETDQWEVYQPQELILPRPQITIDCADLLRHIQQNKQFYDDLQKALDRPNQTHIDVEYEALLTSSEQERLLRYLGVCEWERPLRPDSIKQNPVDLRQSVANYDELAETLDDELADELQDRGL